MPIISANVDRFSFFSPLTHQWLSNELIALFYIVVQFKTGGHCSVMNSYLTGRNVHSLETQISDDFLSLTFDLLNPKSIGFDILSRTTTVPSFKSLQSGFFVFIVLTNTPHTHMHKHTHTPWRRDHNIGAAVLHVVEADNKVSYRKQAARRQFYVTKICQGRGSVVLVCTHFPLTVI